ncbi:MAG: ABC transporter ATP-binding protein [Deltaproteobacteria bacterium HGW-Deltaproteobacteria-20]|nr:MAG: ABC transporter ATP-binding protein [Deltaproteobacteria bacterium HGW-Deltaproteobacteria-20]
MIEVQNLFKYYGERRAVGPLSFSIAQGEIVGLLGLNGAGKTTALRILACDLLPSAGSVTVDGIDVVDQPHEVRRRIGYLPDTPPLYGEMSVREFLVFAARLRGMAKQEADKRAAEAEKVTSLDKVARDPIHSLSHGYKQRVGIAQALVHRPRLLLLDEPILGLDPVQIVEMRHLLRSLRGDFTIVLSSHNLKEISETCDRLLVIREGAILASGTEAELSDKLLRGSRIACTVRGDLARARQAALAVEGVKDVSDATAGEEGQDGHVLQIVADHDVRPALVRALVAAEIDVLGLGHGEGELESIFLRLAGDDARPKPEPDKEAEPGHAPEGSAQAEEEKEET